MLAARGQQPTIRAIATMSAPAPPPGDLERGPAHATEAAPWQPAALSGTIAAEIGPGLRTLRLPGQRAEAAVGVAVLNRMLHAGRPNFVRNPKVVS